MKFVLLSLFAVMCLLGTVTADEFEVGGKTLEIPAPEDFVLVTPAMEEVYHYSQLVDSADLLNENVAYYISAAEAPAALQGELPELKRTFILKANRKLKDKVVGLVNFLELKKATKREYRQIIQEIKAKDPKIYERLNTGIQEQFDLATAIEVSQLVPFEPHFESSHALAVSMFLTIYLPPEEGAAEEAEPVEEISAATATVMNVEGKLLFLFCYAPQDDLEWTRTASRSWTKAIIAANDKPPVASSYPSNFDPLKPDQGDKIAKWILIGAAVLVALAIFVKKNRIKTD
ncbi:hypothetical protein [Gimesia chilikensis]|uniref:hypothetical protein n=1 Tax=Gimesia chilikensis TaxID=2605989 RepID=UPI00118BFE04|nr:hypothetical protein [Gimesia chilikensis]QDT88338.1 hypothetical protein MalM14_60350 [Gimesia chilikensis]